MFTQSTLGFFVTGVTAGILSAACTTPVFSESFMILKTTGHSEAKDYLNREVGMGSTMEVAAFIVKPHYPERQDQVSSNLRKKCQKNEGY